MTVLLLLPPEDDSIPGSSNLENSRGRVSVFERWAEEEEEQQITRIKNAPSRGFQVLLQTVVQSAWQPRKANLPKIESLRAAVDEYSILYFSRNPWRTRVMDE